MDPVNVARESTNVVSVHITASSSEEAHRIAQTVVTERLAACVQVVPGVVSVYRWEGELRRDDEHLLICKTTQARVEALSQRVVELHGHDVPCVVVLGVQGGWSPYLDWVAGEVDPSSAAPGSG